MFALRKHCLCIREFDIDKRVNKWPCIREFDIDKRVNKWLCIREFDIDKRLISGCVYESLT